MMPPLGFSKYDKLNYYQSVLTRPLSCKTFLSYINIRCAWGKMITLSVRSRSRCGRASASKPIRKITQNPLINMTLHLYFDSINIRYVVRLCLELVWCFRAFVYFSILVITLGFVSNSIGQRSSEVGLELNPVGQLISQTNADHPTLEQDLSILLPGIHFILPEDT